MAKYSAIIGVFIRTYAQFEFQAESDEAAPEAAIKNFEDKDGEIIFQDTDWDNMKQPAISEILNNEGRVIFAGGDFSIDEQDAIEYAAKDMLDALHAVKSTVHFQAMSVPLQQQIIAAIEAAKMENRLQA